MYKWNNYRREKLSNAFKEIQLLKVTAKTLTQVTESRAILTLQNPAPVKCSTQISYFHCVYSNIYWLGETSARGSEIYLMWTLKYYHLNLDLLKSFYNNWVYSNQNYILYKSMSQYIIHRQPALAQIWMC